MRNPNDTLAGWAGVPPDMAMWPKKLLDVGYQSPFVGNADWRGGGCKLPPVPGSTWLHSEAGLHAPLSGLRKPSCAVVEQQYADFDLLQLRRR